MTGGSSSAAGLLLAPTLAALGDRAREALLRISAAGYRAVQLSATQPGLRPRDLDRSARRSLCGLLRRLELAPSGLDLWVPSAHYVEPAFVDRAVGAAEAAIDLAADMGHCPLCLILPEADAAQAAPVIEAITQRALRRGVAVADHRVPPVPREYVGAGIDPPAWLSVGLDPIEAVGALADRLISARLCDLLVSGVRGPVGGTEGARLDVGAYRAQLVAHGYFRPVVVDMRQWLDPWRGLEQSARAWEL